MLENIRKFNGYVRLINRGLLANFNLENDLSPLKAFGERKIPRNGMFTFEGNKIFFQFHGTGCFAKINESIEVDFDYKGELFEYLGFDIRKYYAFLISINDNEYSSLESFILDLDIKLELGQVVKVIPNRGCYNLP